MRKFLAVVRREYFKQVWTWAFVLATLAMPLIASLFAFVPMLIFSIQGEAQRVAVVDRSGRIAERLRENLSPAKTAEKARQAARDSLKEIDATQEERMKLGAQQMGNNFIFVDYDGGGKTMEEIRRELNERIQQQRLDAYLIIPPNPDAPDAEFEYYSRNSGDFVANMTIEDALNDAVRSERLAAANISEARLKQLSKRVGLNVTKVSERGEQRDDNGGSLGAAFIIGLLIYLTLTIYGQAIMSAVVEEKETRIAEILFSSARPFVLMMGKLVGVGLAGLTQLAIWLSSALVLLAFSAASLSAAGIPLSMPDVTPLSIVYFFIFFLLGFFIYSTIFALIGSMVTTVQEGGQFAMIPVLVQLVGFYCIMPIARDPNSTFAFWTSVAPFLATITMPVRIAIETPPVWQIALSVLFNLAAILALVWLAARVYRVGMLMYGKRATIPEVWKWIRQS
ncbi:MAG: ABC transporter permease [Acidobacteriota bacterium]|nr:ABC transporter permease [Acidobacteriota bacterium]